MAGQQKKQKYSEETPWFPKYFIGWIGIGNCDQKTIIYCITIQSSESTRPNKLIGDSFYNF